MELYTSQRLVASIVRISTEPSTKLYLKLIQVVRKACFLLLMNSALKMEAIVCHNQLCTALLNSAVTLEIFVRNFESFSKRSFHVLL